MKSWFSIKNLAADTAEVMVYDDIGGYGVSADQFRSEFNAIKAAKIDLRINSCGGDCSVATAMCTAIREHAAEVTAHIDGIAASAACTIACACDKVEIAKSAFMMIHNAASMAFGYASDMRKQADICDKYSDAVAGEISGKTGKSKKVVQKKMDEETWFNSEEAMDFGLADCIKDDDDEETEDRLAMAIVNCADLDRFKNMPDRVRIAIHQASLRPKYRARIKQQLSDPEQSGPTEENPMLNVISKNGKHFVTIDGKEQEITLPENTGSRVETTRLVGKSDEEVAAAVKTARDEGIKVERDYRAMFNTVLSTTGLSGEAAAKFEHTFYGQSEISLKFHAEQVIANRATAVGEGSGEPEPQPGANTPEAKAEAKVCDEAGKRFDEEIGVRRGYGVWTTDPTNEQWKSARARHVAAAARRHKAETKGE